MSRFSTYNQPVADLEIFLLGTPRITVDGIEFITERRKAIAILAYLAVTGRQHPREHLAAFFWPDYDRNSAFSYLRRELYEINNNLGKGWLITDRRIAGLNFHADLKLDIQAFEEALAESRMADNPVPLLKTLVGLYRGDFLSGFFVQDTEPYEDWQRRQTEYFRREYAAVLERLSGLYELSGDWDEALKAGQAWLALDDLNEAAHRALMRIYAGMGERSSAVRQYEICKTELEEELGVEPQAETKALYERIVHDRFGFAPRSSPIEQNEDEPDAKIHLPTLTTPFIGRRPELEQVKELVLRRDNRLVTLFGPGGTGKTRLSIESASEMADRFRDGIWFVPFAPVKSNEEILPAIAKALNFSLRREDDQPSRQLLDYLRNKNLLLVLDNIEHLIEAEVTTILMDLLTEAEQVKLMATTRVRLNIPGEQLFLVSGMRLPEPEEAAAWSDPETQSLPFSAVRLFIDRAQRVHPGFRLDSSNAAAVAEICKLVHGLPLGIELAASWLELLPPDEIAAEIRQNMDFLETSQSNVPERQRSIRAVFDYSWKLLNEIEKEAFLNLSVFVGSFSTEAGRSVSKASLRTLLSLANKSWLQQGHDGRFQLHPLLQHFALERLKTDEKAWRKAQERHADYFANWVAELTRQMRTSGQPEAMVEMDRELNNNIRVAWNWLVDTESWSTIIEKMAEGLFHFGLMRWRGEELIGWFRRARLAIDPSANRDDMFTFTVISTIENYFEEYWGVIESNPVERLNTLWQLVKEEKLSEKLNFWFVVLCNAYLARNHDPGVKSQMVEAVQRLKDQENPWFYGTALILLTDLWSGIMYEQSESEIIEALEIFKKLGTSYEQIIIGQFLASNASAKNRPIDEIAGLYMQVQKNYRKMNDYFGVGIIHWSLAHQYFLHGHLQKGFSEYREMRRIFSDLGNRQMVGQSLSWESLWLMRYGEKSQAIESRQKSLAYNNLHGRQTDVYWDMYELGEVYRVFGELEDAKEMYEEARINFKRVQTLLGLAYYERALGDISICEGRYKDALEHFQVFFDLILQENHDWSIMQAYVKLALAQAHLGELESARKNIYTCLKGLEGAMSDDLRTMALLSETRCLIEEGGYEMAAALAAFILDDPHAWNEMRFLANHQLAEISGFLNKGQLTTASVRFKGREIIDLAEEWLKAYEGSL